MYISLSNVILFIIKLNSSFFIQGAIRFGQETFLLGRLQTAIPDILLHHSAIRHSRSDLLKRQEEQRNRDNNFSGNSAARRSIPIDQ